MGMEIDNLRLRKATADDSEFAYQTKKAAFRMYADRVCWWDEDEQRQLHKRRFSAQDFQVIQVGNIDVGILSLVRQPDCIKVYQLFILPKHQSRGIGAACIKCVIKVGTASKLPIQLQVLKVNSRAFMFFQKFGFRRIGETDIHILMKRIPDRG